MASQRAARAQRAAYSAASPAVTAAGFSQAGAGCSSGSPLSVAQFYTPNLRAAMLLSLTTWQ
jgi:hypothetical protein